MSLTTLQKEIWKNFEKEVKILQKQGLNNTKISYQLNCQIWEVEKALGQVEKPKEKAKQMIDVGLVENFLKKYTGYTLKDEIITGMINNFRDFNKTFNK